MHIYTFVYFDRHGRVAAMDEFEAFDDGTALRIAEGRGWSGSYEVRLGQRAIYAHVGYRLIAGR